VAPHPAAGSAHLDITLLTTRQCPLSPSDDSVNVLARVLSPVATQMSQTKIESYMVYVEPELYI
jgi:hypothetical protein